jgi:hypothetical protein
MYIGAFGIDLERLACLLYGLVKVPPAIECLPQL